MHREIKKIGCAFLFLVIVIISFDNYALCQQLAVKRQTDGICINVFIKGGLEEEVGKN